MYFKNSVIDFPKLFNFTATINWFLFDFKPIIPVLQPFLNLSIFFIKNHLILLSFVLVTRCETGLVFSGTTICF